MIPRSYQWLTPLAAVAVLGATQLWKAAQPDGSVGAPYRAWVQQQIRQFPANAGSWEGVNISLPHGAVEMLKPNAYLSREYVDRDTDDHVSLLFLEVEDARDLMGQYPPNSYPANGWELVRTEPARNALNAHDEWVAGDLHIRGEAYEFRRRSVDGEQQIWVRNFFVLPNNVFYGELGDVTRAAAHFNFRPYGAAEVQVVFDREYAPEDQDRIFGSLIAAHRSLIDAVRFHNRP